VTLVYAAEDISVASRVRTLFDRARDARRQRVETWQRNYKIVHNRAWSPLRESWQPAPQASETYPIISALVGWMTDQRVNTEVIPSMDPHTSTSNFYSQLARDLQVAMTGNWLTNNHDSEVEKVLFDAMIYGTGFFKVGWDGARAGNLGDVILSRIDPFRFYPDPAATSMEDANYFIEARTMSLQELERRWPGSARKLKEGGYEDSSIDQRDDLYRGTGKTPMANPGGVGGGPPLWGLPGQGRDEGVMFDEAVTVYECWVRENEHFTAEDGETFVENSWRVIVVSGNHVIFDAPAKDLWGHGRHPYYRYVLNDLGEFWGIALVEHLAPLQLAINRLLAALQSHAELVGNPVFYEDARSGIARTKITNKPGTRLTKNTGADIGWLVPPEMPASVGELVKFYIGEMERVSGLSAIVRGATPTGRNAQGVLDAIQEASFVRVRLALRNLERSLRDVGEATANLIVENYTTPRLVAVVGPNGQRTSLALGSRHFMVQTANGAVPLKVQLWVTAGSSLPISRMARAQEADTLFALGGIDQIALLEAHDYPNRDQIVKRIMAAQAAGLFQPPGQRDAARA
jgi:hypothetical protein